MLQRLPAEIVLDIVKQAVERLRFTSPSSVLHLAMASSTTYNIVAPIIYHTLVVTSHNRGRLRKFMSDKKTRGAAERVCSYVRLLVYEASFDAKIDFTLFKGLETVYALGSVIGGIARAFDAAQLRPSEPVRSPPVDGGLFSRFISRVKPRSKSPQVVQRSSALTPYAGEPVSLSCIHVWSAEFAGSLLALPEEMRSGIFKACGYLPFYWAGYNEWAKFTFHTAGWVSSILDSLPSLTHLGLILVDPGPDTEAYTAVSMFDLEALVISLRTALGYSRIQMVALQVTGNYIQHRGAEIETAVQQTQDPRFRLWMDTRSATSWDTWNDLSTDDAKNGRNVWTESRAL